MSIPSICVEQSTKQLLETPLVTLILKRQRTGKEISSREIVNSARIPLDSVGTNIKIILDLLENLNSEGTNPSNRKNLHAARDMFRMVIQLLNNEKPILRAFEENGLDTPKTNRAIINLLNFSEDNPSLKNYINMFSKTVGEFYRIVHVFYTSYLNTVIKYEMISEAIENKQLLFGKTGMIPRITVRTGFFYTILENDDKGKVFLRATAEGKYFIRSNGKWFSENQTEVPYHRPMLYSVPNSEKAYRDREIYKKLDKMFELLDYPNTVKENEEPEYSEVA